MNRVLIFLFTIFALTVAACNKQPDATTSPVAAQPATAAAPSASIAVPNASPGAIAVAPSVAMPTPGTASSPLVPLAPGKVGKDGKQQAKGDQKPLPPDLWQRMTRPLSLEEINKLPPETRDMILRAQGRLPASPAPKKK